MSSDWKEFFNTNSLLYVKQIQYTDRGAWGISIQVAHQHGTLNIGDMLLYILRQNKNRRDYYVQSNQKAVWFPSPIQKKILNNLRNLCQLTLHKNRKQSMKWFWWNQRNITFMQDLHCNKIYYNISYCVKLSYCVSIKIFISYHTTKLERNPCKN